MNHEYRFCFQEVELRPMTALESEEYRKLRNRENIRKWFYSTEAISEEQQKKWYGSYLNKENEVMFSIYISGEYAGGIGIYDISDENKTAEVGRLIIDEKYSGNGYGAKALIAASKIAEEIGIGELYASIRSENIASQKSFVKAGFCLRKSNSNISAKLTIK